VFQKVDILGFLKTPLILNFNIALTEKITILFVQKVSHQSLVLVSWNFDCGAKRSSQNSNISELIKHIMVVEDLSKTTHTYTTNHAF